jgi:hypothetical protein
MCVKANLMHWLSETVSTAWNQVETKLKQVLEEIITFLQAPKSIQRHVPIVTVFFSQLFYKRQAYVVWWRILTFSVYMT